MSLSLAQITAHIQALLALDAKLAAVPFIVQIAEDDDEQDAAREYNTRLADALENPGIAFVFIVADGELAGSESIPSLDLQNLAVLSLVENTKKNGTGETAFQYVRRALRVLHRGNSQEMGARAETRLARNAYALGPLGAGKVVYFINLTIRTTEELGALDPATS